MSWDVTLMKDDLPVTVELHTEGGTQAIGGTTDAWLNVTYNYSPYYYKYLDNDKSLNWLNGRKASDCIEQLQAAVMNLGTVRDPDYWKATPGNGGHALGILLRWARQHPDATFEVT